MFDPTTIKGAYEETRDVPEKVANSHDDPELARTFITDLWTLWLGLTGTLLTWGFAHRDICDSAGKLVEMQVPATERAREHA